MQHTHVENDDEYHVIQWDERVNTTAVLQEFRDNLNQTYPHQGVGDWLGLHHPIVDPVQLHLFHKYGNWLHAHVGTYGERWHCVSRNDNFGTMVDCTYKLMLPTKEAAVLFKLTFG